MLSTHGQLLSRERGGRRGPSAKGPPHHGDAGGAAMDQPCEEGSGAGLQPSGRTGTDTAPAPSAPWGAPGDPMQRHRARTACGLSCGRMLLPSSRGRGPHHSPQDREGGAQHPDPLTAQPHGPRLHAQPPGVVLFPLSKPRCDRRSSGAGLPPPAPLPAPRPCPSTRGVTGGHD